MRTLFLRLLSRFTGRKNRPPLPEDDNILTDEQAMAVVAMHAYQTGKTVFAQRDAKGHWIFK